MLVEPVKFVDGLVRGLILTTYDFLLLTLCALAFPFVRRSRRFWPYVIALTKRIPPLTFLFLWIAIAAIFYLQQQDLGKIVLTATLPGLPVILSTFGLTVFVDLVIRLCCWPVHSRCRRDLYESLLRVAVGAIYFGGIVLLLSGRAPHPARPLESTALYGLLGIFVLPLAVVAMKLVGGQIIVRLVVVAAFYLLIPVMVVQTASFAGLKTHGIAPADNKPAQPLVSEYGTQCTIAGNRLNATGYLTTSLDVFILEPRDLQVWAIAPAARIPFDLGRPDASVPRFVLTPKVYVPFTISTQPSDSSRDNFPKDSPFDCSVQTHLDPAQPRYRPRGVVPAPHAQ